MWKLRLRRTSEFFTLISEHRLFQLSSSLSYYSAVALAPFLVIILSLAALVGEDVQLKIIAVTNGFSYELGQMVEIILANVNERVNSSNFSGILGVLIFLFTASVVFHQMRYSFDVIYGFPHQKSWRDHIVERLSAIFIVLGAGLFLLLSSFVPGVLRYLFEGNRNHTEYQIMAFLLNFLVYIVMFWGIHYFAPSRHPRKRDVMQMSVLSAIFFIIGNVLLGIYFRKVATSSVYGAAGTLLIFLIWTYYTSFTLFLSVELFLFVKKSRKKEGAVQGPR